MSNAPIAPALWISAQKMLHGLLHFLCAVSAPAISRLSRRERAAFIDWLRATEALVRKILLIEAQTLTLDRRRLSAMALAKADPRRPSAPPAAQSAVAAKHPVFNLAPAAAREASCGARIRLLGAPVLLSEMWRDASRARRLANLQQAAPPQPNMRLLNRIIALQRVLAKPSAHVRRLARLLARFPRRRLIAAIAARYNGRIPELFDRRALGTAAHAIGPPPAPS